MCFDTVLLRCSCVSHCKGKVLFIEVTCRIGTVLLGGVREQYNVVKYWFCMVDSGKLKIQNLPSEVATDFKKSKDDADSAVREETKTRASFSKKKTSKSTAKEKAEPNVDLYASSKDNSSKNTKYKDGVTSLDIKEPIFVDMNGDVS